MGSGASISSHEKQQEEDGEGARNCQMVELKDLTAKDIADAIASIGTPFLQYKEAIEHNGIDGEVLLMMSMEEIESSLPSLGISSVFHQKAILSRLSHVKEQELIAKKEKVKAKMMMTAEGEVKPNNTCYDCEGKDKDGSDVRSQDEPLMPKMKEKKMVMTEGEETPVESNPPQDTTPKQEESVPEIITRPPRELIGELLTIQGVHLDPQDIEHAAATIVESIKTYKDKWNGHKIGDNVSSSEKEEEFAYDCFLSYRVASDQDVAEKLYYVLSAKNILCFLDKKCLQAAKKWKNGFIQGLQKSRVFVPLISSAGLQPCRSRERDHSHDNVLIEYEYALQNIQSGKQVDGYICPVLVAAYSSSTGGLHKFSDFNPALFSDSIFPSLREDEVSEPIPTHQEKCLHHPGTWEVNFMIASRWSCCKSEREDDPGCQYK